MRIFLLICASNVIISTVICECKPYPVVEGYARTESMFWFKNQLFFVDVTAHKLCSFHALAGKETFCVTLGVSHVNFALPVDAFPNTYVVGSGNKISLFTWNSFANANNPELETLIHVDTDIPGNRLNYASVDPHGRLWYGTVNNPPKYLGTKMGNVCSLDADLKVVYRIRHVTLSSGFVWDLNAQPIPKFYFVDAVKQEIIEYNWHRTKHTIGKRVGVTFNLLKNNINGLAGSLAIDTRGFLWVPIFGEGRVIEVNPITRKVVRSIKIPARKVGGCTFGGPELNILYVSTIGYGYEDPNEIRPKNDWGGYIFAIDDLGVTGSPTVPFWVRPVSFLQLRMPERTRTT